MNLTTETTKRSLSGSVNYNYYNSEETAEYFGSFKQDLFGGEKAILDSLKAEIKDSPILEIGIGGGRITQFLTSLTSDYIGIDYSEKMIEFCRRRFKNLALFVCDARNLSRFEMEQFGAVFFSYNGIDEVSSRDRALVLQEVNRVLKQNGIFMFSSHNLDWESIPSCFREGFSFRSGVFKNIKANLMRLLVYMAGWLNWSVTRIFRKGATVFWEYEASPGIMLPVHYINKEMQARQLRDTGFTDIRITDLDGIPVSNGNAHQTFMLFYTARKNGKGTKSN